MSIATINNKIQGGSSSDEPVLLWTNPSPTSAFAAQTISLDLSKYQSICIKYYLSTDLTTIYGYVFYPMGISTAVASSNKAYPTVIGVVYGNTGGMSGIHRDVTLTTSGVQFGQKGYASSGYGSGTKYAIPVEIYGIEAQIYPSSV